MLDEAGCRRPGDRPGRAEEKWVLGPRREYPGGDAGRQATAHQGKDRRHDPAMSPEAPAADDIRQFLPPDILCSAEDYPDMVHPVDMGKTEPPMTMSLTDSQLVAGYDQPLSSVRFRATRRQ